MARRKDEAKPRDHYRILMPPETRSALSRAVAGLGNISEATRKGIITRIRQNHKREVADAGARQWGPLPGLGRQTLASRYEVMEYLVGCIEQTGLSLGDILQSHQEEANQYGASFPTLADVRRWEKYHPDFAKALRFAEEVRGEILTEQAIKVVLESPEERDPRRIKLEYDALKTHGAILNGRFKEKQVIQTEDITEGMSRDQLLAQVKALMDKHPEMQTLTMDAEVVANGDESAT